MADFDRVMSYFEELSRIPRISGHSDKAAAYLCGVAKKLGLLYKRDDADNVIIYKPGSAGAENKPPVILQGHFDMVGDTAPGVAHDFENDGLTLIRDGDMLRADGTTLGGDDGIAVAMMLAILEDETQSHPPLEALFTSDEEIGLLGAAAVDASWLRGRLMLNLDSEDEGILTAGCAGGMTATTKLPVTYVEKRGCVYTIGISGLLGGHSGVMINKGRGNAIKILGRLLDELSLNEAMAIRTLKGGEKDNVIPFEATAEVLFEGTWDETSDTRLREMVKAFEDKVNHEYDGTDTVSVTLSQQPSWNRWQNPSQKSSHHENAVVSVLDKASCRRVMAQLMNLPYGVVKMTKALPDLVQTSSNVGVVRLDDKVFRTVSSVRSAVASERDLIGRQIITLTEALGGTTTITGCYPAWEFKAESPLRAVMADVWKKQTGKDLVVDIIHAGLECGLFYEKMSDLDAVSIGPTMHDIHTYRESLEISSVRRLCAFVDEVLKRLA